MPDDDGEDSDGRGGGDRWTGGGRVIGGSEPRRRVSDRRYDMFSSIFVIATIITIIIEHLSPITQPGGQTIIGSRQTVTVG